MRVRIRLQDHGVKNHRFWWIVVQPANKNPHGRYLERIGFWLPRKTQTVQRAMIVNKHRIQYWLGMGATCTGRVHRILEQFEYVPKKPVPFGSHTLYEKPEKNYNMSYYKKKGPKGNNAELFLRQQFQEQMTILERRQRLQEEALANLGINGGAAVPSLEEVKTEEIDSEEVDIFERKQKFDELQKRMDKHRKEKLHLRGNDLRFNMYMRKMQKLTRKDLGLDMEAYKDYINNLRQFAHINKDFELLARDSLNVDLPEHRQLIEISFKKNGSLERPEDIGLFNERCQELYNVLRKLKREAAGFLNKRDKQLIEDFTKHPRSYLKHVDIFDQAKGMFDRRQKEQKLAELDNNGLLDLTKVKPTHLEDAGVSLREFDQMRLII